MTKITILQTEDRNITEFRSFEFDILNLFGVCHLMLGALLQMQVGWTLNDAD